MYFEALTFPDRTWIRSTPHGVLHPHTITDNGCFIVACMHSGRQSSPCRLLTYRTPSLPNMEILVSSLHITLSQSSAVHVRCSFAHCARRFFLWVAFRKGFFPRYPCLQSSCTQSTSKSLIRHHNSQLLQNWIDVVCWCSFLFCNDILAILLSVARVVLIFLPFPCWWCPSSENARTAYELLKP